MASHSILIVDDESNQRFVLEQALRLLEEDWLIIVASSAIEALAVIDRQPPDLIITDYHMPEMNGLELIERVRARRIDAQIFLMTAYSSPELQSAAERLGVAHYLMKPVPLATLRQLTTAALCPMPPGRPSA
jgi:CheY-like chemotaxis protein